MPRNRLGPLPPLITAIRRGATVERQIANGADPNERDADGWTPLHWAAAQPDDGHLLVQALLHAKADPLASRGSDGWTALMTAAESGNVKTARALLSAGADACAINADGESALYRAALNADAQMCALLLEWGADPNRSVPTPLCVAVDSALALSTTRHAPALATSRHASAFVATAAALLKGGADPNVRHNFQVKGCYEQGWLLLVAAAAAGHVGLVSALLQAGANVDMKGSMGETALVIAASRGARDVVKVLLAAGASPDVQTTFGLQWEEDSFTQWQITDEPGWNALLAAAARGRADIVGDLLEAGASPHRTDITGVSPLMLAEHVGWGDCARLLREAGARSAAPTPAQVAAMEPYAEMAKAAAAAEAAARAAAELLAEEEAEKARAAAAAEKKRAKKRAAKDKRRQGGGDSHAAGPSAEASAEAAPCEGIHASALSPAAAGPFVNQSVPSTSSATFPPPSAAPTPSTFASLSDASPSAPASAGTPTGTSASSSSAPPQQPPRGRRGNHRRSRSRGPFPAIVSDEVAELLIEGHERMRRLDAEAAARAAAAGGAAATAGGVAATAGRVAATAGDAAATDGSVAATADGMSAAANGASATASGGVTTAGGAAATGCYRPRGEGSRGVQLQAGRQGVEEGSASAGSMRGQAGRQTEAGEPSGGGSRGAQPQPGQQSVEEGDAEHARWCIVCMERSRSVVLLPCRHMVLCEECGRSVQQASNQCPMCRTSIDAAIAVLQI